MIINTKAAKAAINWYILALDGEQVIACVCIVSLADNFRNRNRIESMFTAGEISEAHRDQLLENLYTNTPKPAFFFTDPAIDTDIDNIELMNAIEGSDLGLTIDEFTPTLNIVQQLDSKGFNYYNVIKGNL